MSLDIKNKKQRMRTKNKNIKEANNIQKIEAPKNM